MILFAKDFRRYAREALKNYWVLAILVGVVAVLLGGESISTGNGIELSWNFETGALTLDGPLMDPYVVSGLGVITTSLIASIILQAILHLVIGGTISLGYAQFNLNVIDDTNPQFMDIFSQLSRFKSAFCLSLLREIYVTLWSLLFLIPGVIASLSYSMAYYIMLENPEMSASEAISASKELMNGYKFKLFCLDFSFIDWEILSMFTFGLGDLVIQPYKEAARAAFYRELKDKKYSEPIVCEETW